MSRLKKWSLIALTALGILIVADLTLVLTGTSVLVRQKRYDSGQEIEQLDEETQLRLRMVWILTGPPILVCTYFNGWSIYYAVPMHFVRSDASPEEDQPERELRCPFIETD